MAAVRKRVTRERLLSELSYWRGIRLDFPGRKDEAMRRIDSILDDLLDWDSANGFDS